REPDRILGSRTDEIAQTLRARGPTDRELTASVPADGSCVWWPPGCTRQAQPPPTSLVTGAFGQGLDNRKEKGPSMINARRIAKVRPTPPPVSTSPVEVAVLLGALAFLVGSCVTTGTYRAKESELHRANEQLAAGAGLRARIAELEQRLQDAAQALASATAERDKLRRDLDGEVALIAELQG